MAVPLWVQFLGECVARAARFSFKLADGLTTVGGVVLGALLWALNLKPLSDAPTWAILLMAFGVVFAVRLICAPYWMWRDQRHELQKRQATIEGLEAKYAYALKLGEIGWGSDSNDTGADIGVCLVLLWINLIDRPIEYHLTKVICDGRELLPDYKFVVRAGDSRKYQTDWIRISRAPREISLEVHAEYGPPGAPPVRRLYRRDRVSFPVPLGTVQCITEADQDEPITRHRI